MDTRLTHADALARALDHAEAGAIAEAFHALRAAHAAADCPDARRYNLREAEAFMRAAWGGQAGIPAPAPAEAPGAVDRPTVTACLIVRDEAARLGRCLGSLRGLVDEIVVLDTGSTDDTIAIAASAGALVGRFAWCDDFAAARNASLDLATSEWVLVIDADETLRVGDPAAWRDALTRPGWGSYTLGWNNFASDGRLMQVHRLFRRHPAMRYRGAVHEQLDESLAALGWASTALEGAVIDHDGYADARRNADKGDRNFRCALADTRGAGATQPVAWFHLAAEASALGRQDALEAALAGAADALEAGGYLPLMSHPRLLAIAWYGLAGREDEALAYRERLLAAAPAFRLVLALSAH